MENKWEYALLEWHRFNVEPAPKAIEGEPAEAKDQIIAMFGIRYADGAGKVIHRPVHQVTTKNIGDKSKNLAMVQVMGLLGGGGWEMVTLGQEPDRVDICTVTAAYFKRPAVEGRAVDEPKIDLTFLE